MRSKPGIAWAMVSWWKHRANGSSNERLRDLATANHIAFGTFVGLVALGIADAQYRFVPERVVHAQPARAPSALRLAPTFVPAPGGGGLGIVGVF
jgi:hypothetical protein